MTGSTRGIAFIAVLGWRLVPARRPVSDEHFETGAYLTEVRVPDTDRIGAKGYSYGGTIMWNLGMDPRVKAIVATGYLFNAVLG